MPSLYNLVRFSFDTVTVLELQDIVTGQVLSAEFSNLSELIYDFIPAPANSMPDYPLPVA